MLQYHTKHKAVRRRAKAARKAMRMAAAPTPVAVPEAALEPEPPAKLNTIFSVAAPKDPLKRQQLMDAVSQDGGKALTAPLSALFRHPVVVQPPVLLKAPPAAAVHASPAPRPKPRPSPSPMPQRGHVHVIEDVPATVVVLRSPAPAAASATAPGASPVPRTKKTAEPPSPPEKPVVVSPVPVFMAPAPPAPLLKPKRPFQDSWQQAPDCLFRPSGSNSVSDKQGRLWG